MPPQSPFGQQRSRASPRTPLGGQTGGGGCRRATLDGWPTPGHSAHARKGTQSQPVQEGWEATLYLAPADVTASQAEAHLATSAHRAITQGGEVRAQWVGK